MQNDNKLTEDQRWSLNVNILKKEHVNVGSGIQNIKLEKNTEI
jgi:hypothetical protein